MKCKYCGEPATVTFTEIANKKKRVLRLCEGCAREHNLLPAVPAADELPIPAILQMILGQIVAHAAPDVAELTCPACGLKYGEFRAGGRLGCPHDYEAFRTPLEPILERVHRGLRHEGKVPRRHARTAERAALERQLKAAVAAERYEEAARLRDRLRPKEPPDEPR